MYEDRLADYLNLIDDHINRFGSIEYNEFPHKFDVEKDKVWTIAFNDEIDQETFDPSNVLIFTEESNLVRTLDVQIAEDKKSIKITNQQNYEPEKTYTLHIEKMLFSKSNGLLKNPVKMKFTIKKDEVQEPIIEEPKGDNEQIGTPVVDSNGNVYYLTGVSYSKAFNNRSGKIFSGKTLTSVDPKGNVRWTFTQKDDVFDGPVVLGKDNTLYIKGQHYLYAINLDGSLKWKTNIPEPIHYIPLEYNGIVYVINTSVGDFVEDHQRGSTTYAIDANNGEVIQKSKYTK